MNVRHRSTRILGLTALAVLLGACGWGTAPFGPQPATPGSPATPSTATAAAGNPTIGGVSSDGTVSANRITTLGRRAGFNPGSGILWMDDAERQREMDAMVATGARWIALDFDWNSIQGDGPDSFRWDRSTDTVVREAHERGLRIIGTLAYSPPWARRAACANTSHCFPTDPGAMARFARAAVERYGPTSPIPELHNSVRVWQVWNEANHFPFVQPTVDVAGYAVMLQQTYAAIKPLDPNSVVLAGATAPAGDEPNGQDMAPVTFLRNLYDLGAGRSFDAFAHHPYTFPESPLTVAPWSAFQQTRALHDVMVQHGDANKKVWGTEAGAGTGTDTKSVAPLRQAQLLRDYYTGWNRDFRSFTGPLLWFSVRDSGTDPSSVYGNFGILRHDFRAKPARNALVTLLRG